MRTSRSWLRQACAGLLVIMALGGGAHAEIAPPVLVESSVVDGWTRFPGSVGARYSKTLRYDESGADLLDLNGVAVPGQVKIHATTITVIPDRPLDAEYGPYKVTFRAVSVYQDPGTTPTVDVLRFQVDIGVPRAPVLDLPDTTVPVEDPADRSPGYRYLARVAVTDPSEPFVVRGLAQEMGERFLYEWSGLARVVVRFFDHEGIARATETIDLDCPDACPFDYRFAVAADGLPPGFWTARVGVYDFAGNRSDDSESVSFLVVG